MTKILDKECAIAFNQYCRLKVIEYILNDLVIDLTICKLEGLDHKKYITDLKKNIDEVYNSIIR